MRPGHFKLNDKWGEHLRRSKKVGWGNCCLSFHKFFCDWFLTGIVTGLLSAKKSGMRDFDKPVKWCSHDQYVIYVSKYVCRCTSYVQVDNLTKCLSITYMVFLKYVWKLNCSRVCSDLSNISPFLQKLSYSVHLYKKINASSSRIIRLGSNWLFGKKNWARIKFPLKFN